MKATSSIGSDYKILEQYSHDQLSKLTMKIHAFEKVTEEDVVILDLAAKKAADDGELPNRMNNRNSYERAVKAYKERDIELKKFLATHAVDISAKSYPAIIQRILNVLDSEISENNNKCIF